VKPFRFLYSMKYSTCRCFAFICVCTIFACTNKEQMGKASIVERKCVSDSMLIITYKFEAKGKIYTDSVELKNKIIASDSVSLVFSDKNPQEHTLQLP